MSTADDDGDDIGISDGMEPESPTGENPTGGDEDEDDGDYVAAGGGASVVTPSRSQRPISDKTRELMRAAVAKLKASGGSDEEPLDHEDAPMEPATQAPGAPEEQATKPAESAKEPPPAPSLDPEVLKLKEEHAQRLAELDEREKRITETERTSDLGKLRELYYEKGAPAVVEVIKKWSQASTDDEIKDEIADLVSDLSAQVLGVQIPPEVRERMENRRTRKGIKIWKSEQERLAKEANEREKAAQEERDRVRVKGILQQEITKPEHAKAHPWLAAEPNAGEILVDVIDAQFAKDGTRLTWQEAAKRANDYLEKQSRQWFDARRHLLNAASDQGAAPNGQQPRNQGDQQARRSQAQPAKPPTPPPPAPVKNGKWDPEAHRRQVKGRYRNAFTRQDDE